MGIIEIEGMEFFAHHGCYPEEKITGNNFIVDLMIEADCSKAAVTDKIEDAVNYHTVYLLVKKEMESSSNLLENVAHRIINSLKNNVKGIIRVKIKVSKVFPAMGGHVKKVSVTLDEKFV